MTAMGVIGDVALVQHVEQGVAVLDHLVEHGGEGREVDGDAGEGVEHADGGGALVEEDDEAVGEAHDPVATELREADTEAPGRAGVEEGDLAGVVGAGGVAVAQRDPRARAEQVLPQGGVARRGRARAPAGADGSECNVVHHVAGEHPAGDEAG
ncbi:Os07g0591350 [Oryza sativa Japonica Group]|uniref:Os07g0591350 protein n=1 Tax=Oryza sativa subsp. japonica TaxID=39947 RepID=A0A0P0X8B1_ORYSJ|nr:Os07g0591350 [Oryza sativa Japonica Group]